MEAEFYDSRKTLLMGDVGWRSASEVCPLCQSAVVPLQGAWTEQANRDRYDAALRKLGSSLCRYTVSKCKSCLWWEVFEADYNQIYPNYSRDIYWQAVLKTFALGSAQAPVDALGQYLATHSQHIVDINDKAMERLVADVFKEHFHCDVIHCGKSHDRGVDLLMVIGDELVPVQVKRRMKLGTTESVKVVREMLGVLFRDRARRAVLVSTADHYSAEAKVEIKEVIAKGLVESFDLVDHATFVGLLREKYNAARTSFLNVIPKQLLDE